MDLEGKTTELKNILINLKIASKMNMNCIIALAYEHTEIYNMQVFPVR